MAINNLVEVQYIVMWLYNNLGTPRLREYGTHLTLENDMNNNIKNIKNSIGNIINSATTAVSVSTKLLADGTELVTKGIAATPDVAKATLATPFDAATGYHVENGMSHSDAHDKAFKYVEQPLAETITQVSEGTGALMAALLAEEDAEPTREEK